MNSVGNLGLRNRFTNFGSRIWLAYFGSRIWLTNFDLRIWQIISTLLEKQKVCMIYSQKQGKALQPLVLPLARSAFHIFILNYFI